MYVAYLQMVLLNVFARKLVMTTLIERGNYLTTTNNEYCFEIEYNRI